MANTGGLSSVGVTVSAKNYQVNKNTNLQKLEGVTLNYQTNEYKVNEYNSDNYNDVGNVSPTLDELRQEQPSNQTNDSNKVIQNQYTYEKTWLEKIEYGAARKVSEFANDFDRWLENSGPGVDYACTIVQSFSTGVINVFEDIGDGIIQLGGSAVANIAEALGKDEFAADVKDVTSDAIDDDWSNDLYEENMKTLKVDEDIAHSTVHDVSTMAGSIFGYITLASLTGDIKAAVSKVVMPLVGMLSSIGSSAEIAYQSGATFEQAEIVSTVSGLLGYITGGITDKLGLKGAQDATIKEVLKYGLQSGAASMLEPIINSVTEYNVYAKDMINEAEDKLYDGFMDYYIKSGGIMNTAFAGITSFGGTASKAVGNKINISAKLKSFLVDAKDLLKNNRGGIDLDAIRIKNKLSSDVFENIEKEFLDNFRNFDSGHFKILMNNIDDVCNKNGFDISKLKIIGSGESSLVFDVGDEIIKFSFINYGDSSLKEYVSFSDNILQPDFEVSIDDIKLFGAYKAKLIGQKKLSFDDITESDIFELYGKLRDDGYLWGDTKIENIGRDSDGKLLLLDYGELIYLNNLDSYTQNSELTSHIARKPEFDNYYTNKDFYDSFNDLVNKINDGSFSEVKKMFDELDSEKLNRTLREFGDDDLENIKYIVDKVFEGNIDDLIPKLENRKNLEYFFKIIDDKKNFVSKLEDNQIASLAGQLLNKDVIDLVDDIRLSNVLNFMDDSAIGFLFLTLESNAERARYFINCDDKHIKALLSTMSVSDMKNLGLDLQYYNYYPGLDFKKILRSAEDIDFKYVIDSCDTNDFIKYLREIGDENIISQKINMLNDKQIRSSIINGNKEDVEFFLKYISGENLVKCGNMFPEIFRENINLNIEQINCLKQNLEGRLLVKIDKENPNLKLLDDSLPWDSNLKEIINYVDNDLKVIMKDKLKGYIDIAQIDEKLLKTEFYKHDKYLEFSGSDNSSGFNNGLKSIVDSSYNKILVASNVCHETIHFLSVGDIIDEVSGNVIKKVRGFKIDGQNNGFNECATELITQIILGENHPNKVFNVLTCGYDEGVLKLKKIFDAGVLDENEFIKSYFNNDLTYVKETIDKITFDGCCEQKLFPMFDDAISSDKEVRQKGVDKLEEFIDLIVFIKELERK